MCYTKKNQEGRVKEERYTCFLNYCVSKSIVVVPCFIVWAVTTAEEFDELKKEKYQAANVGEKSVLFNL